MSTTVYCPEMALYVEEELEDGQLILKIDPDLENWMTNHPASSVSKVWEIVFENPDDAFAFKMRFL